jgi:hypothetical protein
MPPKKTKAVVESAPVIARVTRKAKPAERHRKATAPEEVAEINHNQEDIARLAYSLWEERGCPFDSPEVDWFRAEAALTAKA